MDDMAYKVITSQLKNNHQVLVFVHSRNRTERTLACVIEKLEEDGLLWYVKREDQEDYDEAFQKVVVLADLIHYC